MDNGPDPQSDFENLVAPFEEDTGIDVDVTVVGWGDQFEQIRNAAVTGDGPDITQAGTTQVSFFATLGGFDDLNDRVDDIGGSSAYSDGVWSTTQIAGQDDIWALPWFTEARAIYYRTDVLDAAGVDPETAFEDWEAFRATLEAIDDLGEIDGEPIEPFGSPGRQAWDLVHHVLPFVWSAGGAELNEDGTEATIDSDEAQEGIMFFGDLLEDGLYASSELERDGTEVENQFKAGRLATWMGGPWTYASSFRDDDENWTDAARNNIGIAPMPAGPNGDAFTFVGGSNLMMFESSDNQDAAWELMMFLAEPEVQLEYAELLGMYPSVTEAQQTLAEAGDNEAAFLEAIEQGRTFAPIPQWGQIEDALKSRFANVLEMAAGVGDTAYTPDNVATELSAAADETENLLAQDPG
jgi:multiple sugar transport system substrate-binding protein